MKLTPEQLMIPRIMCIGTEPGEPIYPYSHLYSSKFVTGGIITLSEVSVFGNCFITNDKAEWYMKRFLSFPNLFRPMPWYEGRTAVEMPTYLKSKNNERVVKVYDYNCTIMCFRISYATSYTSLSLFIPATEADFIAYQNSKKQ